jgi:hypothetical protein
MIQPRLNMAANHQVFVQQISVITLGVPIRLPSFINPKAKPYWMNFLSHNISLVYLSADHSLRLGCTGD